MREKARLPSGALKDLPRLTLLLLGNAKSNNVALERRCGRQNASSVALKDSLVH